MWLGSGGHMVKAHQNPCLAKPAEDPWCRLGSLATDRCDLVLRPSSLEVLCGSQAPCSLPAASLAPAHYTGHSCKLMSSGLHSPRQNATSAAWCSEFYVTGVVLCLCVCIGTCICACRFSCTWKLEANVALHLKFLGQVFLEPKVC